MFSKRLRELRIERGYSQESLAKLIFVSAQAVGKWERGEATPNPDMIAKLSEIFGVSSDNLLDISGQKKPPVKDERPDADEKEAQAKLADDLYDRLTPENRAKADSYLNYLLAEQAAGEEKQ